MTAIVTLTEEQALWWSINKGNELAWRIASGLAGWMQLCCAQLIGQHIREDPARMALVAIMQAQRGDHWLAINAAPASWNSGQVNERMDVCLGREKDPGTAGVVELKWPWIVAEGDRIALRIDTIQDIARLASVVTSEAPHIRYFVLGLMEQVVEPLFKKPHPKAADRETQRTTLANLLSVDPRDAKRSFSVSELERLFPTLQARTPLDHRLKDGSIKTQVMATEEVSVGNCRLGWVYVWQCDHEVEAQVQPTSAAHDATTT